MHHGYKHHDTFLMDTSIMDTCIIDLCIIDSCIIDVEVERRCWSNLRGSHGLSARRARRTKSRGPKGHQLEVRARRAPTLLVFDICVRCSIFISLFNEFFFLQGLRGQQKVWKDLTQPNLSMINGAKLTLVEGR